MRKKKLAVATFWNNAGEFYLKQITHMLGEFITVESYCFDNRSIEKGIDADLVLISSYSIFEVVRKYVKNNSEIIVANRTLSKSGLESIMELPKGTKAMLVNVSAEMSMETISLLYQLGARHIELTPYYPGMENVPQVDIAITPAEKKYIPTSIKNIIDIGSRVLDISTIMDIAVRLDLEFVLQREVIRKYTREIVPISYGLEKMIGTTNRLESQLEVLLQVFDVGVIGTNKKGVILTYNESAEAIIGNQREAVLGNLAENIFPQIPFNSVLDTYTSIKDIMIKINGYDVIASILPIKQSNTKYGAVAIIRKFNDVERKQHKLRAQVIGKGHKAKYNFEDIRGKSTCIVRVKEIAERMAKSDSSVLITGETGTGKELFAQAIHNSSDRRDYQFVAINCAALPESLLESELFGYEEGAFTGARKGGKPGLFELAHRGTLFLDEIGEMPLSLQARLLRILQEREIMRIGGDSIINVDVRIIAATNKDLRQQVNKGDFRQDLYYRLNVLPLKVPSLRERKEDILLIIEEMKKEFGINFQLTSTAESMFLNHYWEGNIRELRNYIEYLANLNQKQIEVKDLPFTTNNTKPNEGIDTEYKQLYEDFIDCIGSEKSKYFFVLQELDRCYLTKQRLGRRSIAEVALKNNIFITEQEVRRVLQGLEGFCLVEVSKGRGGTKITENGRKIVEIIVKG